MKTIEIIKDKAGNYIDFDLINYAGEPVIEIFTNESNPTLGIDEIDEMIKALEKSKKALMNKSKEDDLW